MKVVARIHKATGALDGITTVSVDTDIDYVQPDEMHDVIEIPSDHPAICEQLKWEISKDRQLKRKILKEDTIS